MMLYVGSKLNVFDRHLLQCYGIGLVVNCSDVPLPPEKEYSGIRYCWYSMADGDQECDRTSLTRDSAGNRMVDLLGIIQQRLTQGCGVFIFCNKGQNRSPALCIRYALLHCVDGNETDVNRRERLERWATYVMHARSLQLYEDAKIVNNRNFQRQLQDMYPVGQGPPTELRRTRSGESTSFWDRKSKDWFTRFSKVWSTNLSDW